MKTYGTSDPVSIVLADGHTTVKEAFEVANEMHDMAEEEANSCNDGIASTLSKGAAIIEMMAAKIAEQRAMSDDEALWIVLDERGNPMHVTINRQMGHDHILECINQHIDAGLWRVVKVRIEL